MANKTIQKVKINGERLKQVLKKEKISIRKLGSEAYNEIQRDEKTIRTYIKANEMPEELLINISRYLNVDPNYFKSTFNPKKPSSNENWWELDRYHHDMDYKNHPFINFSWNRIKYPELFEKILEYNYISKDQFKALQPEERVLIRQELSYAITKVLHEHFEKNALGRNTKEMLIEAEMHLGDTDPTSRYHYLEGIGLDEEKIIFEDSDSSNDPFKQKWGV